MSSLFIIKGKCLVCCKKSSLCKQLICEVFETKSIFLFTSKLRIDTEKYNKFSEENRLICVKCFGILHKFYYKVETKFYETINLTSIKNLNSEFKKMICCLCKQQNKKVLRLIELDIWLYNQKIIKTRFAVDFEIEDKAYRNACLHCYNYLLFLATFYNTINDVNKKSRLETLPEEQENLVTDKDDFEEPCQGTSAVKNLKSLEVIEIYKREENDESTSSSSNFIMADRVFIEKKKVEANQTRFSKFWRRIINRKSDNSHSTN